MPILHAAQDKITQYSIVPLFQLCLPATCPLVPCNGRRVDPGDTWGINLGLALALNPEISINIAREQRFTGKTSVDGNDVPGSFLTVGTVRLRATYVLSPRTSLDVTVVIRLTQDAPDVEFTIALPVRFLFLF